MPTYQIDTGKGVLEVDHDGPLSDLHGAVQSWMDERDPQKQFDAGMAAQQATLPQEGTNLAPGQMSEDQGPSFLPKKYAYDNKGAVEIPPTQQEIADAMQYQKGDTPIMSLPPLMGDEFAGSNAVVSALNSFTTPKSIGMLAGAGVGGAIGIPAKLIAGAFAVDMGKHLVSESIPEVRDAVIATGWTSPETGSALAGAGVTGLMTAGAAGHALDGRPMGGREVASMAESLREKLIPSIQSEATALKQKVFESDVDAMAKEFISKIKPPEISKSDVDGALSEMLGEKQNVTKKVTEQPPPPLLEQPPADNPRAQGSLPNEQTKIEGVPGVSPPAESVQLQPADAAPAITSEPVISKADNTEPASRPLPATQASAETAGGSSPANQNPETFKPSPNSISTASKSLADIIVSKTFREKFLGGVDTPSKTVMHSGMIRVTHDLKVLDSIIELLPVDMVDMLVAGKLTPEMLLHQKSMLERVFSGDLSGSVSPSVNGPSSMTASPATIAAKISSKDATRAASDTDSTGLAVNLHKEESIRNGGTSTTIPTKNQGAASTPEKSGAAPKLRKGQKQGDLLGGSEDLTLMGERKVERAAKPSSEPTVDETVSDAIKAYGDIASAHEHLQSQIDLADTPETTRARLRIAQKKLEQMASDEARKESQSESDAYASDKHELIQSVKELGGLPALSAKGKDATGELRRILEASPNSKSILLTLFRKNGSSLDTLREALNERGFDFETPYDMLSAIEESLSTGRKLHGTMFAEERYTGGPGAMGPVEAADMQVGQTKIGAFNADVERRQAERGAEPSQSAPRQSNETTHGIAEKMIEADPELPDRLVDSINGGTKKSVNREEQSVLLWKLADLENKLKQEQERLTDPSLSPEEHQSALESANGHAERLAQADQANRTAGSASGATLQGRQSLINDDYTFGGLMRKAMNDKGGPLGDGERAKITEQAKQIEELQAKVQEETAKSETTNIQAERASLLEATINDLKKQEADRPKYGKQVFEVAHKIVAKWKTEADEAWAFLNEGPKTVSSGGLSTKELVAWAKVLRGYVGEYGLDFAEASARVIERLGNNVPENIGDTLKKAWVKVQSLIDSEATTKETKRVIKDGVSKPRKGEKTTVDVGARAKAEAGAGLKLSDKVAYEAVRAVINSGVKGELEIMKAAHDLLAPHFPDLTPGQLDVAFGRYGKEYVKFPSKDADKVLLSKTRRLRQLQAAIDDVKSTGKTEKSGLQRDKPDADMRQREAELKAAIEEFGKDIAPSEEQLANKERARLTAAKNSIEKLDRQLQGIEEEIKNTPKEKSVELEQLHAERDAMRALRDEIRAAEKPRPSPEEEYNTKRLKQIEKQIVEAEARIKAGKYAKRTNPATPAKNPAVLKAEAELGKKKEEIRKKQMEQERKNRTIFQKFTSALANLNRVNVLGHLSVLEHLTGAAVENIVTRPVGTALAQVMRFSSTLDAIRQKAAYEGGISAKSEFAGITGTLKSSKALWQKLLHGKSDLDWIHNARVYPKEFLEIVSNTHGAIKEPVRQGIYSRSLQLRMEAAEKMGFNPAADKVLHQTLSAEAYRDANMDIFMGDNFLTKALHNNVNAYLRGQKGDPGLAKFTADVLDILFPIVNVSTNIAIRKFRLAAGIPEAAIRIGSEASKGNLKNGAANLESRDAELITKSFKYGLFGAGLAVFAWKNPQYFGGIYVPGKQAPKDKESGLGLGEVALPGGGHISHHLAHGPVGGYMNQIADARRLYDKEIKDNPKNRWSAMSEAAFFSMFSGAKDLPAFSTISRLSSPFKSAGQKAGEMLRNILIFGGIQDVAKAMDAKERTPKTFVQEMASGIPGARSTVPEKKEQKKKHH